MALTNGIYKSVLHRAAVNNRALRKSLAFFVSPRLDKLVTPPAGLVTRKTPRIYPDFAWATLLDFTQKQYRTDMKTFAAFLKWLERQEPNKEIP